MACPKSTKSLRVVVCEDNHDVSNLIRHVLSEDGFEVALAETVTEARALLAEWSPDLLLLDLLLAASQPTGWDLLADTRRTAHPPVIVISGMGT